MKKSNLLTKFTLSIGPALAEKDFRTMFLLQLFSACGTFLQATALSVETYTLTGSVKLVGLIGLLTFAPVAIFSIPGGVILDMFDKKHVLFITNTILAGLAILLAVLEWKGLLTFNYILIISASSGVVSAVDAPGRSAFMRSLIKNDQNVLSATALNSFMMTSAQIFGPLLAGFLMAFAGMGWTYFANGISFIPVILFLWSVSLVPHIKPQEHPWLMIKNGFHWTASHRDILLLTLLTTFAAFLIRSYPPVVLTKMADTVYHAGKSDHGRLYSWLVGVTGFGAAFAGIFLSSNPFKFSPTAFVKTGLVMGSISFTVLGFICNERIHVFPQATLLGLGMVMLFLNGLSWILVVSTTSAVIQNRAPKKLAGRVLSIYYCALSSGLTIGSYCIGFLVDRFNISAATFVYGGIMLVVTIAAFALLVSPREEVVPVGILA